MNTDISETTKIGELKF